jgi:hypothetical protein
VGRSFTIAALSLAGCGLFPDLSGLSGDASIDASSADVIVDVTTDAPSDAGIDTTAYADARISCEQRPCVEQFGETCCWFYGSQDTCVGADACAGFADLQCYGSAQCLAIGKPACCSTGVTTVCTDVATCNSVNGTILCDCVDDAGLTCDPNDNVCPGTTKCTGTTSFQGYPFKSCK